MACFQKPQEEAQKSNTPSRPLYADQTWIGPENCRKLLPQFTGVRKERRYPLLPLFMDFLQKPKEGAKGSNTSSRALNVNQKWIGAENYRELVDNFCVKYLRE